MKQITLTVVIAFLVGQPAAAQNAATVAENCLAALSSGDRAAFEAAAETIRLWRYESNHVVISAAAKCLSEGLPEPWAYSYVLGKFMTKSELDRLEREKADAAEAERAAEEAAAAAVAGVLDDIRQRKVTVMVEVRTACGELLRRDRVAALTNSVCVPVFLDDGFPYIP